MAKTSGMGVTVLAVVVSLAVAGAGGYMLGQRTADLNANAVATVNGIKITENTLYQKLIGQGGKEALDRMIEEMLVQQAADAAGVKVTAADVDAEIAKIKDRLGGQEALESAMMQYGITMPQLRADQEFRVKVTKILGKDIQATDADLAKYYEENLYMFDTRQVNTRHILVESLDEANAVRAELVGGKDFTQLAKEKSTDPSAAENGGNMGFHPRGQMVLEYDEVAFALQKGELSQPVKSQFGFHIIQLVEATGDTPTFDLSKAKVREAYVSAQVSERIQPWLDDLRAKAKIDNTLSKS